MPIKILIIFLFCGLTNNDANSNTWCNLKFWIRLQTSSYNENNYTLLDSDFKSIIFSKILDDKLNSKQIVDLNNDFQLAHVWNQYFKIFQKQWLKGVKPQSSLIKGIAHKEFKPVFNLEFKKGHIIVQDVSPQQWSTFSQKNQELTIILVGEGKQNIPENFNGNLNEIPYLIQTHAVIKKPLEEYDSENIIEQISTLRRNFFAGSLIIKTALLNYNETSKKMIIKQPQIINIIHQPMRGLVSTQQFMHFLSFLKQKLNPNQKMPFEMFLPVHEHEFPNGPEREKIKETHGHIILKGSI